MITEHYRLWTSVWIGVLILVTTAFPYITSAVITTSGAREISGASGAVAVVFGIYGKLVINLVISIALTWITARRLKDAYMSKVWLLMFFPAIFLGLSVLVMLGTSSGVAFVLGGARGKLPIPWTLIVPVGFILFLWFYEGSRNTFLNFSKDVQGISKITAMVAATFISIITLPSVCMALGAIPYIGKIPMLIGGQLAKIITMPMYKLQVTLNVNLMMIMALAFLCSLAIIMFYDLAESYDDEEDEDDAGYQEPHFAKTSSGSTGNGKLFGR